MNDTPMYKEALSAEKSIRVARALAEAGGIASYSQLAKISGVEGSLLIYHLNRLQSLNLIETPVKGTYRLKYKTPLCFLYDSTEADVAYLGLLGRRGGRNEPETDVALRLLEGEGFSPKLKYVVTSPKALEEWSALKLPYQWILCYEDEIIDIDAIKQKVKPQLEDLLRDYVVILDCTSATKPATIAYYELAQTYLTPLIYVYEETGRLKWLVDREVLESQLGINTSGGRPRERKHR